jgi:hypothetical protein
MFVGHICEGTSVLFEQRYAAGIADGSITLTFRRWKRPQVVAGRTYRTAAGRLTVETVDVVDPLAVTDTDARRAGFGSCAELLAGLRGSTDLPLYRVRFRPAEGSDPRSELAGSSELTAEGVEAIDTRLARLDRASRAGPWTQATLRTIAAHPERRAGDLAVMLGREREDFKLDVRKLKNLGLTLSLPVGYRLSPRGEAYLAARDRRSASSRSASRSSGGSTTSNA